MGLPYFYFLGIINEFVESQYTLMQLERIRLTCDKLGWGPELPDWQRV
jgi:hypothetical protein